MHKVLNLPHTQHSPTSLPNFPYLCAMPIEYTKNEQIGSQPNNPLHGVKLADILQQLVAQLGWKRMAEEVNINCFKSNPTINSSLKFLRKTPWARDKVEQLYLRVTQAK